MKKDLTDDKHDGCRDHAEDDYVVDGHSDQSRVVDLTNLNGTSFVRKKQAQHEL